MEDEIKTLREKLQEKERNGEADEMHELETEQQPTTSANLTKTTELLSRNNAFLDAMFFDDTKVNGGLPPSPTGVTPDDFFGYLCLFLPVDEWRKIPLDPRVLEMVRSKPQHDHYIIQLLTSEERTDTLKNVNRCIEMVRKLLKECTLCARTLGERYVEKQGDMLQYYIPNSRHSPIIFHRLVLQAHNLCTLTRPEYGGRGDCDFEFPS